MAVVDADVKKIIDTNRDTTTFITTAQLLYDELLASAGYSAARQSAIVTYLAAHFCWITDTESLVQKEVGGSKEVYRTYADKSAGLSTSRFGETALALDTSGILAAKTANNGLKALFGVIAQHGNPPAGWPGWTNFV